MNVGNINAEKERILQEVELTRNLSNKRLKRATKNSDVSECVLEFFRRCPERNITVTGTLLQANAEFYAESLGVKNFKASNGWLQVRFCD